MAIQQQLELSIFVISYNTRDLLRTCLRSIAKSAPAHMRYEIVVVDNASVDGSADMVAAEFPQVLLIRNTQNKGFAAANNQALAISRGRYVLLLNSDAVLQVGTLGTMVAFMESQPRVAILGGQLFNADGTFQSSYFDFPDWTSEVLLLSGLSRVLFGATYPSYPESHSRQQCRVDWVSGALFMARRHAIDEVGVLDEDYFMYAEEMDWCFRMRRAGWEVAYLPEAQAVHISAASAHHQPERRRAQVYVSKCLFVHKHWGKWQSRVFLELVRSLSVAKLSAWWAQTLVGNGRRELALAQVASYRLLLSRLSGLAG